MAQAWDTYFFKTMNLNNFFQVSSKDLLLVRSQKGNKASIILKTAVRNREAQVITIQINVAF